MKASKAFHVLDEQGARFRAFLPGEDVPERIARRVGAHVLDEAPEPVEPDEDQEPDENDDEDSGDDGDQGAGSDTGSEAEEDSDEDDSEGDEEEPDLWDPSEHGVDAVNDYLAVADDDERERVLKAERAGKNRKTVDGIDG